MIIKIFLIFVISLNVKAVDIEYKQVSMSIPDDKLIKISVSNLENAGLMLDGKKGWDMLFSELQFERDCDSILVHVTVVSCNAESRLILFDNMYHKSGGEYEKALRYFFGLSPNWRDLYPKGFERKIYKSHLLYSLIPLHVTGSSYPVAIIIDKKTKKTIYIQGNFKQEQLDWLSLK